MSRYKKISISLESELLSQLDSYAMSKRKARSQIISEALLFYFQSKKNDSICEKTREL